jgi:ribosomal protein S5
LGGNRGDGGRSMAMAMAMAMGDGDGEVWWSSSKTLQKKVWG